MAQDDTTAAARNGSSVNDKVAKAKSVLADANRRFPGMGHAAVPAKPMVPAPAPKPSMFRQVSNEAGQVASGIKWNADQAKAAVPKMHRGGPVKKDGVYNLKAGEHVLTEAEAGQARKHALLASGMKSLATQSGRLATTKATDAAPKGDNNKIEVEPLPASALPKPKYGLPTDNRARQMKPGEDIKTT